MFCESKCARGVIVPTLVKGGKKQTKQFVNLMRSCKCNFKSEIGLNLCD